MLGEIAGDQVLPISSLLGGGLLGNPAPAIISTLADEIIDPRTLGPVTYFLAGLITLIFIVGGVFAAIIGGLTLIEKIRGKNKATTRIENDPLQIALAQRFVEHETLTLTLSGYVGKKDLADTEGRIDDKIDAKFTLLDTKRSEDIKGVHEKVESTAQELRAEMNDNAREIRRSIEETPVKVVALLQAGRKT